MWHDRTSFPPEPGSTDLDQRSTRGHETHSVRRFCEIAFGHVGLDHEQYVVIDEAFYRPAEVDLLIGSPAKAESTLGWTPTVGFEDLVTMMVDADLDLLSGRLGPIA